MSLAPEPTLNVPEHTVPVKMPVQGPKKLVQGRAHAYDTEHGVILLGPLANGRLHTLPSHGLRIASPTAAVKPYRLPPPEKVSQRE